MFGAEPEFAQEGRISRACEEILHRERLAMAEKERLKEEEAMQDELDETSRTEAALIN